MPIVLRYFSFFHFVLVLFIPLQFFSTHCVSNQLGAGSNYSSFIPAIPVQPLSYGDAQYFLKALTNNKAPSSWQGDLNFTYFIGPGPAEVELKTVVTPISLFF